MQQIYLQLLLRYPSAKIYLGIGISYFYLKQYETSKQALLQALQLDTANAYIYAYLCLIELLLKPTTTTAGSKACSIPKEEPPPNLSQIEYYFKHLINLKLESAELYIYLAYQLYQIHCYQLSLIACTNAIELNANLSFHYYITALIHHEHKLYEQEFYQIQLAYQNIHHYQTIFFMDEKLTLVQYKKILIKKLYSLSSLLNVEIPKHILSKKKKRKANFK